VTAASVILHELRSSNLASFRTFETILRSQICSTLLEASLKQVFAKFLADETGATAIEYGLNAAGISLAIIAIVNGLGTNLNTVFTSINTSLK
jgi:pilus assembly protein Flp/PilA